MILHKYCANGNDFLLFHSLSTRTDYADLARRACDRHRGIGADGLVVLLPASREGVAYMWDFYNADGSRANMCGNASRCVAHYAYSLGLAPASHCFSTYAGLEARGGGGENLGGAVETSEGGGEARGQTIFVRVRGNFVQSNLGSYRSFFRLGGLRDLAGLLESRLESSEKNALQEGESKWQGLLEWFAIDTGVPHLVCFVRDSRLVGERLGELVPLLALLRRGFHANVNLAYAATRDRIYLATYERGVEAITLACGTGMAASLLVGHLAYGLDASALLIPPSGDMLRLLCVPRDRLDSLKDSCALDSLESNISLESTESKNPLPLDSTQSPLLDSPPLESPPPILEVPSPSIPRLTQIAQARAYQGDMEVFLAGEVQCVAVCHFLL